MSRDPGATKSAGLLLLAFVAGLVLAVGLGVLEVVQSLELDGRAPEVLGEQIEREPTAP